MSLLSETFVVHSTVGISRNSGCFLASESETRGYLVDSMAVLALPQSFLFYPSMMEGHTSAALQSHIHYRFGIVGLHPQFWIAHNTVVGFTIGIALRLFPYTHYSEPYTTIAGYHDNEAVATLICGLGFQGFTTEWAERSPWLDGRFAQVSRLRVWKTSGVGVYIEGRDVMVDNSVAADVGSIAIELVGLSPSLPERLTSLAGGKTHSSSFLLKCPFLRVVNSTVVGTTSNIGTPWFWSAREADAGMSLPAVLPDQHQAVSLFGTAPTEVDGLRAVDLQRRADMTQDVDVAAIGFRSYVAFGDSFVPNVGSSPQSTCRRVQLTNVAQPITLPSALWSPVVKEAVVLDVDGSVTGVGGTYVISNTSRLLPIRDDVPVCDVLESTAHDAAPLCTCHESVSASELFSRAE